MNILRNIEEIISSLLLFVVVSTLFIQYIARAFFDHGFPEIEEFLRFSFLAMVYFASALGAKYGAHFQVNFFIKKMPEKIRAISSVVQFLIWISFNLIVIYTSLEYVFGRLSKYPQISDMLRIDMRLIFLIIPIAFILQTVRLTQDFTKRVKAKKLAEFQ